MADLVLCEMTSLRIIGIFIIILNDKKNYSHIQKNQENNILSQEIRQTVTSEQFFDVK